MNRIIPTFNKTRFFVMHLLGSRNYATKATSLVYTKHGEPIDVIQSKVIEINPPASNEVLIKYLAAPVNPADINTIQGVYPERPPLPAVAGNEGVGEILEVGKEVKGLRQGDRVIPSIWGLGTWRTHAIYSVNDLIKVPKELPLVEAATFSVNPCTAYRMLKDFKNLKANDTVIQNGANSACGQNVIQICKAFGINSVNVVRNRPEIDELKKYLLNIGATCVLTEEEVRTTDIFKSGKLKQPMLALNCVGGKSASNIMRHLSHNGAMVTYGGMSRESVSIPTSSFIFKNITSYGYWLTRWNKDNANNESRKQMIADLVELMLANKLTGPQHQFIKFDNYKEAITNTLSIQGFIGKKYILNFQ